MATIDRTSEFFALCQSLPGGHEASLPNTSASTTEQQHLLSNSSTSGRYSNSLSTSSSNNDPTSELRTFHTTASHLSKEIYTTSTLLSELTSLIHSRSHSLFVDESERVNALVLRIKTNIESLNTKLDETNTMIQRNKRRLGRNSQAGQEASNLVGQLQEEFVNTTKGFKEVLKVRSDLIKERSDKRSEVFGRRAGGANAGAGANGEGNQDGFVLGNKPRVYDINNSTNNATTGNTGELEFGKGGLGSTGGMGMNVPKLDLDLTSGLMNKGYNAGGVGTEISGGDSVSQLPRPQGVHGEGGGSTVGMRQRYGTNASSDIPTYSGSISSHSNMDGSQNRNILPVYTPHDIQRMEEQTGQSQMMQLIPDQNYLRERADAMSQVETNIVELGTIFNKLAVMVNEHQEMVQRVEDNVDSANDNINLSLATLTDTLDNLRTNKALFMKVFTVLVVFIILFITFFA